MRALLVLLLLFLVAAGASWVAERPGSVGYAGPDGEIVLQPAEALAAALAALAAAVVLVDLLRTLFTGPAQRRRRVRAKRREDALRALSDGLIALAAGKVDAAKAAAKAARKAAPDEPLTDLLSAQTAQAEGDGAAARSAFLTLSRAERSKALGERGLHIEAMRAGDTAGAQAHAEAALRSDPTLAWARQAVIAEHVAAGRFDEALHHLGGERGGRRSRGDRRTRAVILTARALARQDSDPDAARKDALEAHGLDKSLVPAAAVAARLLGAKPRQAQAVLEATAKLSPHPDLFAAARALDDAGDGKAIVSRAEALAAGRPADPESAVGVARAALAARQPDRARSALGPLVDRPERRVLLLMAELAAREGGDEAQVREWLLKAARARPDPAWIADGLPFSKWRAVGPVSRRLDAFAWGPVPQGDPDALVGRPLDPSAFKPVPALPSPDAKRAADAPAASVPSTGP